MQHDCECPVCFDQKRPSQLIPYGACNKGHIVCGACAQRIILNAENSRCPTCRSESFAITTDNIIYNEALEKASKTIDYKCIHNCGKTFKWDEIENHENRCPKRKYECLRCHDSHLIEQFLALDNPCLHRIHHSLINSQFPSYHWKFHVDIDMLDNMETGHTLYFLLRSRICRDRPPSKLMLTLTARETDIFPQLIWMGERENIDESLANFKVHMRVKGIKGLDELELNFVSALKFINDPPGIESSMDDWKIEYGRLYMWENYFYPFAVDPAGENNSPRIEIDIKFLLVPIVPSIYFDFS